MLLRTCKSKPLTCFLLHDSPQIPWVFSFISQGGPRPQNTKNLSCEVDSSQVSPKKSSEYQPSTLSSGTAGANGTSPSRGAKRRRVVLTRHSHLPIDRSPTHAHDQMRDLKCRAWLGGGPGSLTSLCSERVKLGGLYFPNWELQNHMCPVWASLYERDTKICGCPVGCGH